MADGDQETRQDGEETGRAEEARPLQEALLTAQSPGSR
jgi:hypothetical protein